MSMIYLKYLNLKKNIYLHQIDNKVNLIIPLFSLIHQMIVGISKDWINNNSSKKIVTI